MEVSKESKKGWSMNPNRNDEASFRPNISGNEEEQGLPEGGRWKIDCIRDRRYRKPKKLDFFNFFDLGCFNLLVILLQCGR